MVASTEKVSLSLESGALTLARRAAEIEQMTLSAYVSALLRRHAWDSERPILGPDEQARADADLVALDDREEGARGTGEHRAAG